MRGIAAVLAVAAVAIAVPAAASRLLGPYVFAFQSGSDRLASGERRRLDAMTRELKPFASGTSAYLCAPGEAGRADSAALRSKRVAVVRGALRRAGIRAVHYRPDRCGALQQEERAQGEVIVRIWPEWR